MARRRTLRTNRMADPSTGFLKILSPGLHTLVADFGRPGYRSLGVAIGGAADRRSLALGNALVGNPPDAAALEICLSGPTLSTTCPVGCVVFGAPFEIATPQRRIVPGHTFTLWPEEELRIAGTARGARAYCCIRGGLLVPPLLGSRSGFTPLRAGDELGCVASTMHTRFLAPEVAEPILAEETVLRVLDGAQANEFRNEDFYGAAAVFRVSTDSDRMGLRLQGPRLAVPAKEIISEPLCPGTVQVTRDGQCVVMGVDCQTVGGYPKIAHVIAADLDVVGQLAPGTAVRFRRVSLPEAEALYQEKQRNLAGWLTRLGRRRYSR